jgi:hypothetical protein
MAEQLGIVKHIGDVQQINEKFKKRDLLLECKEGNYINTIPFEFTRDKTSLLDNVKVGSFVKVNYKLRGREVNGKDGTKKHFVSLDSWNISEAKEN